MVHGSKSYNPADVVKAFGDIGAKWLVPMHYYAL